MPYYEYHCGTNGRTLEVRHGMDERVETWGDLVRRAGLDAGGTPADAPVERLLSVPVPLTASTSEPASRSKAPFRGCGQGCACAAGAAEA